MNNITCNTLGETWRSLVKTTKQNGIELADEGLEIIDVRVKFNHNSKTRDSILEKYADKNMIDNMMKVFFSAEKNSLGHNYSDKIKTPFNGNYLTDIVMVLKNKAISKKATLTLNSTGDGKVPCINVINFLIRDNELSTYYFARGQDAYKKFYADALCISKMQIEIAKQLSVKTGSITGYIASAHIYHEDNKKIDHFLTERV
jgi:thymidylate synthase